MSLRVAILGSTRGTNLKPLYYGLQAQDLPVEITLVLSDKPSAGILETAKDLGIPTRCISATGLSRDAYGEKLHTVFQELRIDLIVLIGFLRILSGNLTRQWSHRIINVHPSLLPAHAGLMDLDVHKAVLACGDSESGCSVHLVEETVDTGKILVQKHCRVESHETAMSLKTKIQALEVTALIEAIALFC